jgi:hypothetical protein
LYDSKSTAEKIKKSHKLIHRDPADPYIKNPYNQIDQKKPITKIEEKDGSTTLGRPHPAAGAGGHRRATSPGQIRATTIA